MKYYDTIPEDFLLIRFVTTRYCNYRCEYCYLTMDQRTNKKTMFSHHGVDEWLSALKENFSDRKLELYFTGGEPLIVPEVIELIKEAVTWDNVIGVRIDSNISAAENFVKLVDSSKVKFLASFHPTQIPFDKYMKKLNVLRERDMLAIVNFVASKENFDCIGVAPHELASQFKDMGMFLNLAKDFQRGLEHGYDPDYKKYIDMHQFPLDTLYMDYVNANLGYLCGSGKHYITLNRHGNVYSCGNKNRREVGHGNIFDKTLKLPDSFLSCEEICCPSIIQYGFSTSNDFSPVDHAIGYVKRCSTTREGISPEFVEEQWKKIDLENISGPSQKGERKDLPGKVKEILKIIRN